MSDVDEEMMVKLDDRGDANTEAGVSLGSDAWRRLRRNPMAMLSLAMLVTIGVLAFLTPMLPLQPPDQDDDAAAIRAAAYFSRCLRRPSTSIGRPSNAMPQDLRKREMSSRHATADWPRCEVRLRASQSISRRRARSNEERTSWPTSSSIPTGRSAIPTSTG